ncbi:unnamed protein product [Pedinophyceae sp. YPF-701]|nr:unnamed protein product [Pedinophyceae sp. YPF-701]
MPLTSSEIPLPRARHCRNWAARSPNVAKHRRRASSAACRRDALAALGAQLLPASISPVPDSTVNRDNGGGRDATYQQQGDPDVRRRLDPLAADILREDSERERVRATQQLLDDMIGLE